MRTGKRSTPLAGPFVGAELAGEWRVCLKVMIHPLKSKTRLSRSAVCCVLLFLTTAIDASPLAPRRSAPEPSACADLRAASAEERRYWLGELARGSREHLMVSADMMELGLLPKNPELQRRRLLDAAADPRARYNLAFVLVRDLQARQMTPEQAHPFLQSFGPKDFSGALGARTGYLYWHAAQMADYTQRPEVALEALRMAFGGGVPEAGVLLWEQAEARHEHLLGDKAFLDFFRLSLSRSAAQHVQTMRLMALLWQRGYYPANPESTRQYYADLYGTVSDLMAKEAGITIDDPWPLQGKAKAGSDTEYVERIHRDAWAYIKAKDAAHRPTQINYLLVCQWQQP